MNANQRRLVRRFYQSIPTAEDKAKFSEVVELDRNARVRYAAQLLGRGIVDEATMNAIIAAGSLTKEDRIAIFSGAIRQWIFSILGI